MKPYRIIFLGTPEFAVPALEALIKDDRFNIIVVITEPDRPAGRGKEIKLSVIKLLGEKHKIPVFQPTLIENCKLKIENLQPDLAVVVAYGQIIPQEILDIPKHGFINIHPSLLPKYRGSSPIQAAILNDDKETGVSIIQLDEKMDHGDVVASVRLKTEDIRLGYQELSEKLSNIGAKLLIKTLPDYLSGKVKAKPQDHTKATFTKLIKKTDGEINWNQPVEFIERQIRAYNPWPSTYTFWGGRRIKICQAHIEYDKLVIDQVQPEGKRQMTWQEFKKGYKNLLNYIDIKVKR